MPDGLPARQREQEPDRCAGDATRVPVGRRRSLCCPVKVVATLNCFTALDIISEELVEKFQGDFCRLSAQIDLMRPAARANAAFTGEEPASSGNGTGSGGSGTCAARD